MRVPETGPQLLARAARTPGAPLSGGTAVLSCCKAPGVLAEGEDGQVASAHDSDSNHGCHHLLSTASAPDTQR